MKGKIAIIAVTINHEVLKDFLKSLKKQTNKNYHLFLVDIATEKKSIDSTGIQMTILPTENRGYSYGVNQGIKGAIKNGFTKYCIINDDTLFEKDFVTHVLTALTQHPGSIIGGKIYYAAGYEYHKARYTQKDLGQVIWYAGGQINWNHALAEHRGVDEVDHNQFEVFEQTDFVNGCFMIYDTSVLQAVGNWDESYFLYFEDADFCERAKRKNIKLYYDPSLHIWHKVSQSTGGSGSSLHVTYQRRNRLRFGLKYAPLRTKFHLLKNYLLEKLFSN